MEWSPPSPILFDVMPVDRFAFDVELLCLAQRPPCGDRLGERAPMRMVPSLCGQWLVSADPSLGELVGREVAVGCVRGGCRSATR